MRLKNKLLFPVIVTVIVGVTFAITYLYRNSEETIIYEIQEYMEDGVSISVKYIDSWLDERIADVHTWSTQAVYREALTEKGDEGKNAGQVASAHAAQVHLRGAGAGRQRGALRSRESGQAPSHLSR